MTKEERLVHYEENIWEKMLKKARRLERPMSFMVVTQSDPAVVESKIQNAVDSWLGGGSPSPAASSSHQPMFSTFSSFDKSKSGHGSIAEAYSTDPDIAKLRLKHGKVKEKEKSKEKSEDKHHNKHKEKEKEKGKEKDKDKKKKEKSKLGTEVQPPPRARGQHTHIWRAHRSGRRTL